MLLEYIFFSIYVVLLGYATYTDFKTMTVSLKVQGMLYFTTGLFAVVEHTLNNNLTPFIIFIAVTVLFLILTLIEYLTKTNLIEKYIGGADVKILCMLIPFIYVTYFTFVLNLFFFYIIACIGIYLRYKKLNIQFPFLIVILPAFITTYLFGVATQYYFAAVIGIIILTILKVVTKK